MLFPLHHLHASIILNVKNKVLNTLNMYQAKVQVCVIFFQRRLTWCHGHLKKCSLFIGSVVMQAQAQPSLAVTATVR